MFRRNLSLAVVGFSLFGAVAAHAAAPCSPNLSEPECAKLRANTLVANSWRAVTVGVEVSGAGRVAVPAGVSGTVVKIAAVIPFTAGGTSATLYPKINGVGLGASNTLNIPSATTPYTGQVSASLVATASNTIVTPGDILEISASNGLTSQLAGSNSPIANTRALVTFYISPSSF